MRLTRLPVSALLACVLSQAAQPVDWGPTADGLRMALEVTGSGQSTSLRVTIQNAASDRRLVPVAVHLGKDTISYLLNLQIEPETGAPHSLPLTPKRIRSGIVRLITADLLPGASYTVQVALSTVCPAEGCPETNPRPANWKVNLMPPGPGLSCTPETGTNPVGCWSGKLESNVVRMK